jgi:hypothetical protein
MRGHASCSNLLAFTGTKVQKLTCWYSHAGPRQLLQFTCFYGYKSTKTNLLVLPCGATPAAPRTASSAYIYAYIRMSCQLLLLPEMLLLPEILRMLTQRFYYYCWQLRCMLTQTFYAYADAEILRLVLAATLSASTTARDTPSVAALLQLLREILRLLQLCCSSVAATARDTPSQSASQSRIYER